jgi:phenylpyruvate tautomerase PptA (4-oxalocrotonate tautomerase family)
MPIIKLHYPVGRLDNETKAILAQKLTDVLVQMEGGANTDGGRAFAAVLFTAVAEDDWWVGEASTINSLHPEGNSSPTSRSPRAI